ncbi:hypothetical protein HS7_19290 [Sulfolobales archaeon HS-7]|nr:hypothetical protein HS7_19290 [Sulfolobales archaeon HS-7]
MESTASQIEEIIYSKIRQAGEKGIKQADVSKILGISSAEAARNVTRLIRKGLVRKEATIVDGKKVVMLYIANNDNIDIIANLGNIIDIPCFSCKLINKCQNGSHVSPQSCNKMNRWLIEAL